MFRSGWSKQRSGDSWKDYNATSGHCWSAEAQLRSVELVSWGQVWQHIITLQKTHQIGNHFTFLAIRNCWISWSCLFNQHIIIHQSTADEKAFFNFQTHQISLIHVDWTPINYISFVSVKCQRRSIVKKRFLPISDQHLRVAADVPSCITLRWCDELTVGEPDETLVTSGSKRSSRLQENWCRMKLLKTQNFCFHTTAETTPDDIFIHLNCVKIASSMVHFKKNNWFYSIFYGLQL